MKSDPFNKKRARGKLELITDGSRYIVCSNGKIIYQFQFDLISIV